MQPMIDPSHHFHRHQRLILFFSLWSIPKPPCIFGLHGKSAPHNEAPKATTLRGYYLTFPVLLIISPNLQKIGSSIATFNWRSYTFDSTDTDIRPTLPDQEVISQHYFTDTSTQIMIQSHLPADFISPQFLRTLSPIVENVAKLAGRRRSEAIPCLHSVSG